MFELVYYKLKNFYNQTANLYVNLVADRPLHFITIYLFMTALFSLGLLQIKFNLDTDALAIVRNSECVHNAIILNKTFRSNQNERHYNNKLLDLGYYFEMIINVKQLNATKRNSNNDLFLPSYNFLNVTILEEYNRLFDAVKSLQIADETRTYSYSDLCARRLNKCSVEGGLMRRESFQNRLLNHEVGYPINDNKHTYVDSTEMDALSVNLIFGLYRKEIIIDNEGDSSQGKLAPVHSGTVRNRFDLLYNSEKNRKLAIKFMKRFTQFIGEIKQNNTYPHLNMSYFTSHSLTDEIEKYSKIDTNYVLVSIAFFWLTMLISFIISPTKKNDANLIRPSLSSSSSSSTIKSFLIQKYTSFSWKNVLNNGAWYLTFIVLLQIVFTFTASFGVLSLLGVRVNFLTATIVFILLILCCNQAYLLFVNVTIWNVNNDKKSVLDEYNLNSNNNNNNAINEDQTVYDCCFNSNNQPLTKAAQQILVPNFFSVSASILTYFLIGMTSSFDSIRVYCIFTNFCLAFNFFGQLAFYFPFLVLHLRRVNSGRNCLTFRYSNDRQNNISEKTRRTSNLIIDPSNDKEEISIQSSNKDNNVNLLIDEDEKEKSENNSNVRTTTTTTTTTNRFKYRIASYKDKLKKASIFNFLFDSKFKYILFLLFVFYFAINSIICHTKFHTNLPITDLIPSKSFLKEHMINHMTLFDIGPIVTIAFMKQLEYWKPEVFYKIGAFLDDAKKLDGMDRLLEINWLNDTYYNGKLKDFFDDKCKDPLNFECFRETFKETVYDNDFYRDDAVFNENTLNTSLDIKASRVYLQFKNFSGTLDEVNLMHNLKSLAKTKYNFSESDMIIFSPVYIFLEQLEEILPSMVSIFLLNFESALLASFFILFDFKTLIIQIIMMISLLLSVIASAVVFNLTLNIVTLYHFLLLPALICEFLFNIPYFFLYKASQLSREQKEQQQQLQDQQQKMCKPNDEALFNSNENETNTDDINEISIKKNESQNRQENKNNDLSSSTNATFNNLKLKYRVKQLKFAYDQCIKPTAMFALFIVMLNFSIMYSCSTYNFQTLYIFLMSFSFNLFLHLFLFYPNLLILFGTCWIKDTENKIGLLDINVNV